MAQIGPSRVPFGPTIALIIDAAGKTTRTEHRWLRINSGASLDNQQGIDDSREAFVRRLVFCQIAALNVAINLGSGGVPAALTNIQHTFGLSASQLGLLGSLTYLGQALGCLVGGPLLKRFSPAAVCTAAVTLNAAVTALFAGSSSGLMCLSTRFLVGLLQAPITVYFPVWVHEYGPEQSRTKWMALIQAGTPLGISCGYLADGLVTQDENDVVGWRVPFFAQAAVLLCFSLAFAFMPRSHFDLPSQLAEADPILIGAVVASSISLDVDDDGAAAPAAVEELSSDSGGAAEAGGRPSPSEYAPSERKRDMEPRALRLPLGVEEAVPLASCTSSASIGGSQDELPGEDMPRRGGPPEEQAKSAREGRSGAVGRRREPMSTADAVACLFNTPVYLRTVLSLTALYFVVTGIQFWWTAYAVDVLGAPKDLVVLWFAIGAIAMPLLGVITGSTIVDRLGGFQTKRGVARTLRVSSLFATLAATSALVTCFISPGLGAFPTVVSLIFVTLFFGGCIIPAATGVIMESSPPEARPVASALSMFANQVLGYALSPLVSSVVMEFTGSGNSISPAQLHLGFRIVMSWGTLGAIGFVYACRAADLELGDDEHSNTSPSPVSDQK